MKIYKKIEGQREYGDIIDLPHHVSRTRPRMSISERAAQFSPFAALTGYEEAVEETARLTDSFIELNDNSKEALNEKINFLSTYIKEKPSVSITCFVYDDKKEGGRYVKLSGKLNRINPEEGFILIDDKKINLDLIFSIESELLDRLK